MSPVATFSSRASATIEPGPADCTGSCFLPNSRAMPERRTPALPREALTSGVAGVSVPVKTRTTESFPCCGWTMVLQTCATTGPAGFGSTGRPSASLRGSVSGEGNSVETASTSAATPMLFSALPTSTGMIWSCAQSSHKSRSISSCGGSLPSSSSSISVSSKSASASSRIVRCEATVPLIPSGTAVLLPSAPYAAPCARSTKPANVGPAPIGSCVATTCGPYASRSAARVASKFAPGRSSLLMKKRCGVFRISKCSTMPAVWATRSGSASITITAASTAVSTVFVSSKKSMNPGVSTSVMSTGPHVVCAKPQQTDCR